MMLSEFEKLTGLEVTTAEYEKSRLNIWKAPMTKQSSARCGSKRRASKAP